MNLLREGLDLPEVSLVAILDADKEGFLRSQGSLIQTMGRAARNVNGMAVLYADVMTGSMRSAIEETSRRRATQEAYNREHGITPQTIVKPVDMMLLQIAEGDYVDLTAGADEPEEEPVSVEEIGALVTALEDQMRAAAREFEFEKAAQLRDRIRDLRQKMIAA
ncbi:MAG: UvrB/UvrC motif-containing protein [Bryobacterales bacterium]|nr:UvrB/UvrC motif-containing protein [Bryobacterales bacterium]